MKLATLSSVIYIPSKAFFSFLSCSNFLFQIPKELLDKVLLEQHFSQFGQVLKVSVSVAKELAIVYFDSHESAKNAKDNGRAVSAMLPEIGAIFFGKGSFAVLFTKKCLSVY